MFAIGKVGTKNQLSDKSYVAENETRAYVYRHIYIYIYIYMHIHRQVKVIMMVATTVALAETMGKRSMTIGMTLLMKTATTLTMTRCP